MGKKAKTRFVIRTDGVDRELFSVRDDAKDGSINIILRETPYWHEPGGDRSWRTAERRYSVHPSSRTTGTTIKYTTIADDGRFEYSSFINDTERELLWLAWASRQWKFEGDNYLNLRPADDIVHLGEFDDNFNTLIYAIWIWDTGRKMASVETPLFFKGACFRNFQVSIYYTFIPVPAFNEGQSLHISTSTLRRDGGDFQHTHPDVKSYSPCDVSGVTWSIFEKLRSDYMERISTETESPETHDYYSNCSFMFGCIFTPGK